MPVLDFFPHNRANKQKRDGDGEGPILEWFDVGLATDAVDSWTISSVFGGNPGAANSAWGLSDPE